MRGHETKSHPRRAKITRRIVAYDFLQILWANVVNISVNGVAVILLESSSQLTHNIRSCEEIVGIEDSHNISRGHTHAFVHAVVRSFVGFGNILPYLVTIFLDDGRSIVRAPTIHNNVLYVGIVLRENTFDGVLNSATVVIDCCDDGYLEHSGCWDGLKACQRL